MPNDAVRNRYLTGYLCALAAGVLWGTTGPLSTALYSAGAALTDVGFWRVLLAVLGFLVYGAFRRDLFRMDRRGLLVVALLGGVCVAIFEVGYQFAIRGVGVAGAATLLYLGPTLVAVAAQPLLGERLSAGRLIIALLVLCGVALTVTGVVSGDGVRLAADRAVFIAGLTGGLLAACSYAGMTLIARYAAPKYGAVRVLFFELVGGVTFLGIFLPLFGHAPQPASTVAGWLYIAALGLGAVVAANLFFFEGARRIEAAPTSVAASIEPVVGALLALMLFRQGLTAAGWLGLFIVVGSVSAGYLREAREPQPQRATPE